MSLSSMLRFGDDYEGVIMNGKHSGLHKIKHRKKLLAEAIATDTRRGKISPSDQAKLSLIRREYRILHLAHCYIRGRSYRAVEQPSGKLPNKLPEWFWGRVQSQVDRHGGSIVEMPPVESWARVN